MLRSSSATPIANGLWPNEWGPNHRHVATRTGDRVRVKLSTGWTITYTDGERPADVSAPGYRQATGAIERRCITRGQPLIAKLLAEVEHRLGAQAPVEVIVEQHLRGAHDEITRDRGVGTAIDSHGWNLSSAVP